MGCAIRAERAALISRHVRYFATEYLESSYTSIYADTRLQNVCVLRDPAHTCDICIATYGGWVPQRYSFPFCAIYLSVLLI